MKNPSTPTKQETQTNQVKIFPEERLHGCSKPIRYVEVGECWTCTSHFLNARRMGNQYICIQRNSKIKALHRHIWELANKRRLKPGETVKHTCSNPRCINPEHLVLENRNPKAGYKKRKLTMEQASKVRRLNFEGWTQQALAVLFGVCQGTIHNIVSYKTYVDCPPTAEDLKAA